MTANPCAEPVLGNIEIYLHFLSFLNIKMAQVLQIHAMEDKDLIISVWNSVKSVVGPHALNRKS